MKLIIDIDEEVHKGLIDDTHVFVKPIFDAIKNGTPIPDNATNGDVLEQIRAEIIKQFEGCYLEEDMTDERKAEHKAYKNVLKIIDKYRKSEE